MGDEPEGAPPVSPDLQSERRKLLGRWAIQGDEGLVHQEELGLDHEGPGEGGRALHPDRGPIGVSVTEVGQVHRGQDPADVRLVRRRILQADHLGA